MTSNPVDSIDVVYANIMDLFMLFLVGKYKQQISREWLSGDLS